MLSPTDKIELRNGKSNTAKEGEEKDRGNQTPTEWQLSGPKGKRMSMFTNLCAHVNQSASNSKK